MSPTLLTLLTFLAVVLAVGGIYSLMMDLFLRDRSRLNDRINEEFRHQQRERAKKTSLFRDLGKLREEVGAGEPDIQQQFLDLIDQSGMENLTAPKLLGMMAGGGFVFGVLGFAVFNLTGFAVGLPVGVFVPLGFVMFKRKQRLDKLRSQLPDVFDLMSRVLRAGQTITQAMQAVSDEFSEPIAVEFALCSEMMNLGIPPEAAFQDLARRSGVMELKIFVMALMINRETGGNLAEVLDNLSAVVRDRFRINGQIKTLTAEGRLQAAVLLALPPAMLVIMLVVNRAYAQDLLDRPILIVMMLVSEFIGALWIRSIVNFDF